MELQCFVRVIIQKSYLISAFLTEAHADAEAQAQAQVPQAQVGEVQVSDVNSNVNSANSPVVVS